MDLDKLKNTWNNAEIKPTIDAQQIQQMLNNKGKSAYNNLLTYEVFGAALFILLALLVLFYPLRTPYIHYFFVASIILGGSWQLYKIYFLKHIDITNMNVLQVSENIAKYKRYIIREWIAGILWTMTFCILFISHFLIDNLLDCNSIKGCVLTLLIFIGLCSFILGITYIIYKCTIHRLIKKVEKSITEIKDLQKSNRE